MIHVRELPPLRLHIEAVTPTGNRYRWGDDEPNPANIPAGLTFSSAMPGGYEQLDVSLARKAGVDYSDLARLSTLRVRGPGGDIAWEGRLERTPRVSGDQMAISPSAVGWQAHLDDDKSAREIYVDRDLQNFAGPISTARQVALINGPPLRNINGSVVEISRDLSGGNPALKIGQSSINNTVSTGPLETGEAWYDANGIPLDRIYYSVETHQPSGSMSGSAWIVAAFLASTDDASTFDAGTDLDGGGAEYLVATTTDRRFALFQFYFNGTFSGDGTWTAYWKNLAAYGRHGLTRRGPDPGGVYASDVVTNAVGRWAPLLTIDGTVQASSFVIQHLAFLDPTTAGEIVRQATSFGLQDWAVWDNRTFYWAQRGTYGRKWRARIAPAQLSETGPQLDRLWESVIVSYTDVDGTTRTVGPVGSGADTEDAVLHDTDPENPANQLGIIRREMLSMGISTAAGATEVGRRFLEEQKLLDTSGQAQLVGHVMDDHGVLHPYWRVRAGDTISFVDASDTSERRIVRASHDHGSRTCTVDLDAPPEGLDALLARLGVVLVPLGVAA